MKRIFIILTSLFLLNNLTSMSSYEPLDSNDSTLDLGIFKDYNSNEVKSYYQNLKEGISGEELLLSLEIILKKGQKLLSDDSVHHNEWSFYLLVDRDYEKDPLTDNEIKTQTWKKENVICSPLYDETFTFVNMKSNPGNKVNREHVFPKSYGFGNTGKDFLPIAGTDMHNLHMGEANNNQNGHNNYSYGNVANKATATKITSTISGNITGYYGNNKDGIPVYEPLDKDKGDIARSIFYMAARYHTYDATLSNSPALKLSDKPTNIYDNKKTIYAAETKDNPCEYGILSDLLEWNELDPVDDHEIHRNNLVYTVLQNNRNPFIDYPNWARIAFETFDTGISKDNPSQVSGNSDPDTPDEPDNPDTPDEPDNPDTPDEPDNPDTPDEPDNPDTPDEPDKSQTPWYKDLTNPKYYPYYGIAAFVLLSFIISTVCVSSNKKKKKGSTKKKKAPKNNKSKSSIYSTSSSSNSKNSKNATQDNKKSTNTKK